MSLSALRKARLIQYAKTMMFAMAPQIIISRSAAAADWSFRVIGCVRSMIHQSPHGGTSHFRVKPMAGDYNAGSVEVSRKTFRSDGGGFSVRRVVKRALAIAGSLQDESRHPRRSLPPRNVHFRFPRSCRENLRLLREKIVALRENSSAYFASRFFFAH